MIIIPHLDEAALDATFVKPGRNEACHCRSGRKYKRCHEEADQAAWRTVAAARKSAQTACMLLGAMPSDMFDAL